MRFWSKHLATLRYKLHYLSPVLKTDCCRILCYGDSNTWGYPPGGGARFRADIRWPGILQHRLGKKFIVFEDGLSGRTTRLDDPHKADANSRRTMIPSLRHFAPLDLVVLVLGTNDLKARFDQSALSIAGGIEQLCRDISGAKVGRDRGVPEILIVAPPPIAHLTSESRDEFDGAVEKSMRLAHYFSETASRLNHHFVDAAKYISANRMDPIHWDSSAHQAFGVMMAEKVMAIRHQMQI